MNKKARWILISVLAFFLFILVFNNNYVPVISLDDEKNSRISTTKAEFELKGDIISSKTATLTINKVPVPLKDDGTFTYKVSLKEGDNTFNLVATNENGNKEEVVTIRLLTKEEQENATKNLTDEEKEAQSEAKKKAEKEKVRQDIVSRFASRYCAEKQGTKVKLSESGVAEGWPGNDGSGWTNEQCLTIISKLYDGGATEQELELVVKGNYAIGMLEMSLLYSLGSPSKINRTHRSGFTSAQYVYGDPLRDAIYIYTENGRVTSVQN